MTESIIPFLGPNVARLCIHCLNLTFCLLPGSLEGLVVVHCNIMLELSIIFIARIIDLNYCSVIIALILF
ncbi:hypothetical protein Lalb_Chr04g0257141 [Lupinus albus]|uniref:Uncharacterized protein n=1 Tax=Lupinus albus TaxID=3870 RepID=A0A6A4QQS8_LUPAL|nr:hypothetical protein Lalb_Chr04g0257141 [Lupinus albus]